MNIETAKASIGAAVTYHQPNQPVEKGVITGANNRHVFVRYRGDRYSKATAAELLELAPTTERTTD